MNMRFILCFFFLGSIAADVVGQNFQPVSENSKVGFTIRNFGLKTSGKFSGLTGNIVFDPVNLNQSSFDVSVSTTTVDTDNNARDKHLRKSDYFDAANFPTISFISKKITTSSLPGRFYVIGTLTIKGKSKEIGFGFSAKQTAIGYIFDGEFNINRRDFGVGGKSISLSDDVKVSLSINTKQ